MPTDMMTEMNRLGTFIVNEEQIGHERIKKFMAYITVHQVDVEFGGRRLRVLAECRLFKESEKPLEYHIWLTPEGVRVEPVTLPVTS